MATPITDFDPSNFDIHDLCKEYELDIEFQQLVLNLPFGITFDAQKPDMPDPGDIIAPLLNGANVALMPLTPIFDIIDVLFLIKEVFDAVKSLNPFEIGAMIGKLIIKLDKLKKLIPQLSIPTTIKSLLNLIIALLLAIKADLLHIILEQSRIDLAGARAIALGSLGMKAALSCAQVNLDAHLDVLVNNAKPLNRLINLINLLCSLAGLPEVPTLDNIGADAAAALAPIDDLVVTLRSLRDKIPV
jgi:hypothetical protein